MNFFFLSNFSNPLINRWGLNIFWYNYWFKYNYSYNINQNNLIEKLINIFIIFGLKFSKSMFNNNYFFKINLIEFNKKINSNFKYYKLINFKNSLININSFFFLRIDNNLICNSKLWILNYQNWFIICFFFLKNFKKKKNIKNFNKLIFFKKLNKFNFKYFMYLIFYIINKNYYIF